MTEALNTEARNVRLDFEGGIASLSLTRPDAGNAISQAMADELVAAVAEIARRPECGVVVLISAGKSFCVGGLDDEGATIARLGRGSESAARIEAFVNRPHTPRS
jgi:enoyl-CoA hydratase/carnithine racemase